MHDKNGTPIKVGDKVLIEAYVKDAQPAGDFCNLTVVTCEDMPGNKAPTSVTLNAKQVVKFAGAAACLLLLGLFGFAGKAKANESEDIVKAVWAFRAAPPAAADGCICGPDCNCPPGSCPANCPAEVSADFSWPVTAPQAGNYCLPGQPCYNGTATAGGTVTQSYGTASAGGPQAKGGPVRRLLGRLFHPFGGKLRAGGGGCGGG